MGGSIDVALYIKAAAEFLLQRTELTDLEISRVSNILNHGLGNSEFAEAGGHWGYGALVKDENQIAFWIDIEAGYIGDSNLFREIGLVRIFLLSLVHLPTNLFVQNRLVVCILFEHVFQSQLFAGLLVKIIDPDGVAGIGLGNLRVKADAQDIWVQSGNFVTAVGRFANGCFPLCLCLSAYNTAGSKNSDEHNDSENFFDCVFHKENSFHVPSLI